MEPEPTLLQLSQKLDAVYASCEKTRKYLQWTLIATLIAFVLPLIAAVLFVPAAVSQYSSTLESLTQ